MNDLRNLRPGAPVVVVEHLDDGTPKPGGRTFPAVVDSADGCYIHVGSTDAPLASPFPIGGMWLDRAFWADSGWRARFRGERRWRLEPAGGAR